MSYHRAFAVLVVFALAPHALADNPLEFFGEVTESDLIAELSPSDNLSFYMDMTRINFSESGSYNFQMTAGESLSPWLGITADGDFDLENYGTTPFIRERSSATGGGTVLFDLDLSAGVYEISNGSYWYRENSMGLNLGAYTMVITGPPGSEITIVPAPGAMALLGFGGLIGLRRRR
ncbi:MAG: MYXO-CTERM domain-containing protein [Phycisphaerales bacterium]|jgi:MYXO-CTERM domain-containing protein